MIRPRLCHGCFVTNPAMARCHRPKVKDHRLDSAVFYWVTRSIFLARVCSSGYKVKHICDDLRGRVVRDNIAVIVAILISRRRWRNVGIICSRYRLEAIAARNPLSPREVRPSLRMATPALDVIAIVRLELATVLIAEAKVVSLISLVSMMVVISLVPMVILCLRNSYADCCYENWNHDPLSQFACYCLCTHSCSFGG
jgi:hypothetical protein